MQTIAKAACAVLLGLLAGPARATSFTATLDPIKVYARPGQVANRTFSLTLAAEEEGKLFRAKIEDWWPSEDGKQSYYRKPGTLERSCSEWVSLNPVESAVAGGETLTVRLSVATPTEVGAGGHWCVLTVDEVANPETASIGVGARFLASISIGIFVYVEPVNRSARITNVDVVNEEARIRLENDGNTPIGVEGRLEFFPPRGASQLERRSDGQRNTRKREDVAPESAEPIATMVIPRRTIVPEPVSSAILSASLPAAAVLPSGRYLVRFILDIGVDHYIGVQKELEILRETPIARAK